MILQFRQWPLYVTILLIALVVCWSAQAATNYVTPSGVGLFNGSDWDNAYSNIQDAVDASTGSVDFIYLKHGTYTNGVYTNSSQIAISNHPGLTIRGGYEGEGAPGSFTNELSIITRDPGVNVRIFYCNTATVTLERVTITNGYPSGNGGGLELIDCEMIVSNCIVSGNSVVGGTTRYGMGIYASGGMLTVRDCVLVGNNDPDAYVDYGGAICANGVDVTLKSTTFSNNRIGANHSCEGGALHLTGGSALIDDCSFLTNYIYITAGGSQAHYGGAVYANGVSSLTITNCSFTGNYSKGSARKGGVLYLYGAGTISIMDCDISGNSADSSAEDIYADTTGSLLIRNTVIEGGSDRGIYKLGSGSLTVTNSLIAQQPSHGIEAVAGTISVGNSTLANNVGWGLTNSGATVTVLDCIVWGNTEGGLSTSNLTVTYTCSQEPHTGVGNTNVGPEFVAGYYLSVSGLTYQSTDSPCINAGSADASTKGLDTRTTRTDGTGDSSTVDMGYHYQAGESGISNLVLYVDVISGTNSNDGWSWGDALKTITEALSRAINGSTINIATGLYDAAAGESFPLTLQDSGITLRGTNREATIVNAGGSDRVFSATGRGQLKFEGLTISNGYSKIGAGMYLVNDQTTITNCTVTDNHPVSGAPDDGRYGVGIYASGGTLIIHDSLLVANVDTEAYVQYGGAIYASGMNVDLADVMFADNRIGGNNNGWGAGVCLSGGSAFINNCAFLTNWITMGGFTKNYGAAIYADGVGPLIITNCSFVGNYVTGGKGGVMYLAGAGLAAMISDCRISNNWNVSSVEDMYLDTSGSITIDRTIIAGGSERGVYKLGTGSLGMTNCLIRSYPSHGVQAGAGTVTIGNSTLTGNTGWGLTNGLATVTVKNSIVWTNTLGGIATNAGDVVTYTCSQELLGGDGNKSADPLFENAATNNYRLSKASPCINAGNNEAWMVNATDLDGSPRINSKTVDMGAYEVQLPSSGTMFMCQ